jgi:hypothetical protein
MRVVMTLDEQRSYLRLCDGGSTAADVKAYQGWAMRQYLLSGRQSNYTFRVTWADRQYRRAAK